MSQALGDMPKLAPTRAGTPLSNGWQSPGPLRSAPDAAPFLDAIDGAAVLLDPGRRVLASNDRGIRLMRDGYMLRNDRAGRLKIARPADNEALERGLTRISEKPGALLLLLRLAVPGAAPEYLARLISVRGSPPQALLLLHPLTAARVSPAVIQTAFALSAAEARLAAALVKGQSLSEYAAESGLSRNTARNQLSGIFAKTGARRQTELVALAVATLGPGWAR